MPFARELWTYNPKVAIFKVNEPILVVIGKKDIQVDGQADGKVLENATAKKTNITDIYPENANHVLKHDETPKDQLTAQAALRYNAMETELDQKTVVEIVKWLKQQT